MSTLSACWKITTVTRVVLYHDFWVVTPPPLSSTSTELTCAGFSSGFWKKRQAFGCGHSFSCIADIFLSYASIYSLTDHVLNKFVTNCEPLTEIKTDLRSIKVKLSPARPDPFKRKRRPIVINASTLSHHACAFTTENVISGDSRTMGWENRRSGARYHLHQK